ncbi:hypothetical protein ACGFZB_09615 [Streptomyces cinerochromogenes]|uniref:Uncharacterized protein n=1 Tax=Streptomyces cinerochromogenes TaxID=66422 RepID=A0ABW7B0L8_9ACTN
MPALLDGGFAAHARPAAVRTDRVRYPAGAQGLSREEMPQQLAEFRAGVPGAAAPQ